MQGGVKPQEAIKTPEHFQHEDFKSKEDHKLGKITKDVMFASVCKEIMGCLQQDHNVVTLNTETEDFVCLCIKQQHGNLIAREPMKLKKVLTSVVQQLGFGEKNFPVEENSDDDKATVEHR